MVQGVVAEPASEASIVRPDVDLITVVPLKVSTRDPVEQQVVRARQQLIESFVALEDARVARQRGDHAATDRADLRAKLAQRRATSHVDAAIALVEALGARTAPSPARRSRELVLLGYAFEIAHRETEADGVAAELISICPRCAASGEAHLRLGDRAFAAATDAASLAPAIEHFAAAAAVERAAAELRAFAEYKLAWCLYNLGDQAGAVAHLRWSAALATSGGKKGERLAREALRDADRLLRNLPLSDDL